MKDRIMLDASMILHRDSLNQLLGLAKADALDSVIVSGAFIRMLESFVDERPYNIRRSSLYNLSEFFQIPINLISRTSIREFLSILQNSGISIYERKGSFDNEIFKNLYEQTNDELLAEILFEEWEFLTTNSWITAKTRAAFDAIVEAGSVAICLSQKAFEVAVRKTIKKPTGNLSPNDKVKAAAKWIAVGGSVVADFVSPIPGVILNLSSGLFLLCDP